MKFSILIFFSLFLFATVSGFAQETENGRGIISDYINWAGVKGPFRFESYCSPKENVFWSVAGRGNVSFQSTEKGFHESREYQLPYQDFEESLYGVWFDTKGSGWVVGGEGTILKTTDNGYSWHQQVSNTDEDLKRITCIDAKYCWVLGRNEIYLRTINAGKTWEQMDDISGNDIEFADSKNGWIVDDNAVMRTANGGKTWAKSTIDTNVKKQKGAYDDTYFSSIKFINKKVGWVVGNRKLARTADGGKTWSVVEISYEDDPDFVGVVSSSEKTALAINKGKYNYCTEDSGKTWNKCFRRQDVNEK